MKKVAFVISFTLISMFYIFFVNVNAEIVNVDGFEFDTETGTIIKYTGSESNLVIPSQINGFDVKKIGDSAFSNCISVTKIKIPNNVTSIGNSAFLECGNLLEINIPDNVMSIGRGAFLKCRSLLEINIPDGVTVIENITFFGCTSLTKIEIPNSILLIKDSAFNSCISLKEINVNENNMQYSSENGILFNKEKTMLIRFPLNSVFELYSIPSNVTYIENYAFEGCEHLIEIRIPNSVTSIGNCVFEGCINLIKINIPNSITSIGDYAFSTCINLVEIEIPNSITSIGDYAFSTCTNLVEIEIPDSVISIGNQSFYNCISLENINVNMDNINYLSENGILFDKEKTKLIQFPAGSLFKSYTIPNSVKFIGEGAFSNCQGLITISISNNVVSIKESAFNGSKNITEINIPNSITSIESGVFANCENLTKVNLPDSIVSIKGFAFYHCKKLKEVNIPNNITSIESCVFYNCESLIKIEIPSSVTSIESSAFSGCKNLTEVNIPNSVTLIESGAFSECENLTKVNISDSIDVINSWMFNKCKNLIEVQIPNSVKSIDVYSFFDCKSLEKVIIPNSVKSINTDAFANCTNLKSIYCYKNSIADNKSLYRDSNVKFYYLDNMNIIDFSIKDTEARAGEEVEVYINADNNTLGMAVYDLKVNFDKTKLIPISIEQVNSSQIGGNFISNMDNPNTDLSNLDFINVLWDNKSNITYNGDLFKIKFKIKDNVEYSEIPITLEFDEDGILNENSESIAPNITNGKITVYPPYKFGDINMDGKINTKDLLLLNQYIAEYNNIIFSPSQIYLADVYRDGVIDVSDLLLLRQYLVGWGDIILGQEIVNPVSIFGNNLLNFNLTSKYISPDKIKVDVSINDNPGISAFKLKLNYDKDILTPLSLENGNILKGDITTNISSSLNNDYVTAVWSDAGNNTNNGILYSVIFEIKNKNASNTKIELMETEKDIINIDFEHIKLNSLSKDINLSQIENEENIIYGDVDGDNVITANDAALILNYVLNPQEFNFTEKQKKSAKVSDKESINITAIDAEYVLKKSVNQDFVFPIEK